MHAHLLSGAYGYSDVVGFRVKLSSEPTFLPPTTPYLKIPTHPPTHPPNMQSFTKEYSTQLRYASLMRRSERLDDAMYYWSHQKYLGMPDLLQQVTSVLT
jgi:hypothetical protein